MTQATVLVDAAGLRGEGLEIGGDLHRHLFRARRHQVGDRLKLVDGQGGCRWATVTAITRDRAQLALGEPATAREPQREVRLLAPTFRPERASWLVEKTTELGVREISFFRCERAPRALGEGQVRRLERVAASALQQSGGSRAPAIRWLESWELGVAELVRGASVLLDPEGASEVEIAPDRAVTVIVGPEGGLTDDERNEVIAAGALPFALGPRVLRVETAAVVGVSRFVD